MTAAARLLVLVALVVGTGCGRTREVARDAAVTTFRVIDAPANYVRRRIDAEEAGTTETTTTTQTTVTSSDVVTPGRPVSPRPPTTAGMQPGSGSVPGTTTRPPRRESTGATGSPSAPARPTPAPASDFPVARAVPGKPGFVYSVDPQGGIVDVTGYKSGDKAKDPYTKQIFIVP